jgi:endonuclease/exonuclease/phosphatase family metal-dependent hydrolase
MENLKKTLRIGFNIINGLAIILFLLASFSDYVSPTWVVIFSYLGLFYPFILAGFLLITLIQLLLRQWKIGFVNLLVCLICFNSIQTYFPINLKTSQIPEGSIKILTYNVMRFGNLKDKGNNKVLKYIKDNNADIVCIQEFGASKDNPNLLSEKDIMNHLKNYPYYEMINQYFPYPGGTYGLVVFSKFPILSHKKIPYESAFNASSVTEIDIHGKRLTLINNHLESNKLSEEERSNYYKMTQDFGSKPLDVFTQMMAKRLTPAYKIRAEQARAVAEVIKQNKNPYIVVCGDFNDTPISYARHKIKGNLHDAFVDSGMGLGITYNLYRFLFRIDYILHGDNIKSYNCTVGKLKNSDHYPVSCYLKLED